MLDAREVMELLTSGQPLPQEQFGEIPDAVVGALLAAEPKVLSEAMRAFEEGRDPIRTALTAIDRLSNEYGWYATCSTLAIAMAHRFEASDIPDHSALGGDTGALLRTFTAAVSREKEDDKVWVIPATMLASLSRDEARDFTARIAFYALYKALTPRGRP